VTEAIFTAVKIELFQAAVGHWQMLDNATSALLGVQ